MVLNFIQFLPSSIRGVVLGFAARAVGSIENDCSSDDESQSLSGALCVVFNCESLGLAGALARMFTRVSGRQMLSFPALIMSYSNHFVGWDH